MAKKTKRLSSVPSPLHAIGNWFRSNHLRLLIAGLAAVGLIGAISTFAATAKQNITVWVNPQEVMRGTPVTSSGNGSGCDGVTKYTAGDKVVFNCNYDVHVRIAVPKSRNGYTVPSEARVFNTKDNANVVFDYNKDAAPNNPPSNPNPPAQNDDKAQVKVWVNPRPAANGMNVSIVGAGCGGGSQVNSNNSNGGAIIFGNCKVGEKVTVRVPKTFQSDGWDYQVGNANDNSEVRDITVAKSDDANVISYNFYGGQTASPVDQTALIKVVVNPTDKTAGKTNVSIRGGHCKAADGTLVYNQTKPVGPQGFAAFGNCDVGAGYKVTIDKTSFTDASGTWFAGPLATQERYLPHLDKKTQNDNDASWEPTYEFTLQTPAAPDKGSLAVKSFNDVNCNKVQDAGEATLPNAPYSYTGPNGAGEDGLNTGPAGSNTTADLEAGNYEVTTTAPGGFKTCSDETQQVTVQSGQTATVTLGYQAVATEAGTGNVTAIVYNDKNGNGVHDTDESGISNVNVTAKIKTDTSSTGGVKAETNDEGTATLSELPNDTYTVSAQPASGFVSTTPSIKDVTVKDNTQTVEFGQQQVASPAPTNNPNTNNGGDNGSQAGGNKGGIVGAVAGALPKTGPGWIVFITFLAAVGGYYGYRFYQRRKAAK